MTTDAKRVAQKRRKVIAIRAPEKERGRIWCGAVRNRFGSLVSGPSTDVCFLDLLVEYAAECACTGGSLRAGRTKTIFL